LFVSVGCEGRSPSEPERTSLTLEERVRAARSGYGVPALAAAVIELDGAPEVAVSGVRRQGSTDSVSGVDRFHLGSEAKAMLATAAGRLVERGELEWTLAVTETFPEVEGSIHPGYGTVTLHDLLIHRAGIQSYTTGEEWELLPNFDGSPVERRREFAGWLLARAPAAQPGTYVYSNAGYGIAAAMLEEVTGLSWEQLIRRELFDPLDLEESGFGWPAADGSSQPWGHWMVSGALQPHPPDHPYRIPELLRPAGDIHMSTGDFARFVQLHLRGLHGRATLLRPETVQRLHTPVGGYALGWGVRTEGGGTVSVHNGSAGTFYATMAVSHASGRAVVAVANAGGAPGRDAVAQLVEWLLEE
jgi:CubicO group peptidase (beta-lactamase class C family)